VEVQEKTIYTPEETESLLKISRSTFLRLIKRGALQARKVGGQYRILGEEILKIVKPKGRK
jgi:excisionase family DNA binding protein